MSERRYALIRIAAGDYLLPSNDAQTLWHIYSFVDGYIGGLDEPNRTYWGCARYPGTLEQAQAAVERDIDNYGYIQHGDWREVETYQPTRKAAIDAALKYETREKVA